VALSFFIFVEFYRNRKSILIDVSCAKCEAGEGICYRSGGGLLIILAGHIGLGV
jgi:hypothetical protein